MLAIKKIKKQLKTDGYVLIKGFFLKTKDKVKYSAQARFHAIKNIKI